MQEKRKFDRCKLEQKAKLSGLSGQQEEGSLLDIGIGGMKILMDREVKPKSQLSGQFKVVPYLDPFYVKGVVVWAKPVKDEPTACWEVGVRFTKVSAIPIQ